MGAGNRLTNTRPISTKLPRPRPLGPARFSTLCGSVSAVDQTLPQAVAPRRSRPVIRLGFAGFWDSFKSLGGSGLGVRRRFERFTEVCQNLPDRPRIADRMSAATGGCQECEGQGWFRTRKAV